MMKELHDPVSSITHMVGAVVAIPVTIALIIYASLAGSIWGVIAYTIFGLSILALYTASTVYHMIPIKEATTQIKYIARRVDHMMIYVLIAGTYTPVCLITLKGIWGYTILSIIWALAFAGIIFKLFVLNENKIVRYISTSLYLVMGWLAVVAAFPLTEQMDTLSFILLLAGGISYSIGAIIYALKKPDLGIEWLSFHDIFHFFVLIGSQFHIIMMFTLL